MFYILTKGFVEILKSKKGTHHKISALFLKLFLDLKNTII